MSKVYVIIHDEVDSPSDILGVFNDKAKAEKVLAFIKDLEGISPYDEYKICSCDVNQLVIDV